MISIMAQFPTEEITTVVPDNSDIIESDASLENIDDNSNREDDELSVDSESSLLSSDDSLDSFIE